MNPICAPTALPASATDKIKPLLQAAQIRAAEIIEMQRPLVINLAEALLSEWQLLSERLQDLLQDNQRTRPPAKMPTSARALHEQRHALPETSARA